MENHISEDAPVSVIITTHRRDVSTLRRAIDSVYQQSFQGFEIIVVDDFPEFELHEDIVSLVHGYDDRIRYLVNVKNRGANGSRNLGIKESKGEFIALLDDDDAWFQNKLEVMLERFEPEIGLVYARYVIADGAKDVLQKNCEGHILDELLLYGNFLGGCSVPVIRKDVLLQAGMFDEAFGSSQDYDLWIRIAKISKIAFADQVVVNYYLTENSISSHFARKGRNIRRMLNKYTDDFSRLPEAKYRLLLSGLSNFSRDFCWREAFQLYAENKDAISFPDFTIRMVRGTLRGILYQLQR